MIALTVTRLDVFDRFQFTIEMEGAVHAITEDAVTAATILSDLGIEDPASLVEHARTWGAVEIVPPGPGMAAPR